MGLRGQALILSENKGCPGAEQVRLQQKQSRRLLEEVGRGGPSGWSRWLGAEAVESRSENRTCAKGGQSKVHGGTVRVTETLLPLKPVVRVREEEREGTEKVKVCLFPVPLEPAEGLGRTGWPAQTKLYTHRASCLTCSLPSFLVLVARGMNERGHRAAKRANR